MKKKRQVIQPEHGSSEAHLSTSLHTGRRNTEIKMHTQYLGFAYLVPQFIT